MPDSTLIIEVDGERWEIVVVPDLAAVHDWRVLGEHAVEPAHRELAVINPRDRTIMLTPRFNHGDLATAIEHVVELVRQGGRRGDGLLATREQPVDRR